MTYVISVWLVIYVLVLHWVADFVCQNDTMALNKSESNFILFVHSLLYFVVLGLGVLIVDLLGYYQSSIFLAVNLPFHFVIDYFTSRINKRLFIEGKRHWFFVVVSFDQLLHYIVLFLTV